MTEKAKHFGPVKFLVSAASGVVAAGTFFAVEHFGFLIAPPPLRPSDSGGYWLGLATIACGATFTLVALILPWKKTQSVRWKYPVAGATIGVLIGFIVVAGYYDHHRVKRTAQVFYQGAYQPSIIGATFTSDALRFNARKKPLPEVLAALGWDVDRVWTLQGRQMRWDQLGYTYLSAVAFGGVLLALLGWVALHIRQK